MRQSRERDESNRDPCRPSASSHHPPNLTQGARSPATTPQDSIIYLTPPGSTPKLTQSYDLKRVNEKRGLRKSLKAVFLASFRLLRENEA